MNHTPAIERETSMTSAISIAGLAHTYRGTRKTAPRTAIAGLTFP